jgi:hypothetical protein
MRAGRATGWSCAAGVLLCVTAKGQFRAPEPDPPTAQAAAGSTRRGCATGSSAATLNGPSQEWTLHKTADGLHPNGDEQQLVWLMNRARRDPTAEGLWLAMLRQLDVQQAMDYFDVLRTVLVDEFAARTPSPPAAFDARLYLAAADHCAYLISVDGQTHDGQFSRVTARGFIYTWVLGSVYSYSHGACYGHAGFNVDWGPGDATGMQPGRGHRQALMGGTSCVGAACVPEDDPATAVGPMVITINYCYANAGAADHYNRFLVGTTWTDANANGMYDPGEGLGGVTVMPDSGTWYAVTGAAGGYAIPVDAGTYTLTYSGGPLTSTVTTQVTVGAVSVLVDWTNGPAKPVMTSAASLAANGSVSYTLTGQQKGVAYVVGSSCTAPRADDWTWTGVLPQGYGDTLTWSIPLFTNAPRRFVSLEGWSY